jgi:hypothetical protein
MERTCTICRAQLTGRQTVFCSLACKNASTNNKHQNYETQQQRGRHRRRLLIEGKAGVVKFVGTQKITPRLPFITSTPQPNLSRSTLEDALTPLGNDCWMKRASVNFSA